MSLLQEKRRGRALHCGIASEALRKSLGWGWASGWFRAEGVAAGLELSEAPGDWGGGGSRSRGWIRQGEEPRHPAGAPSADLEKPGGSRPEHRGNGRRNAWCGTTEPLQGPGGGRPLAVHRGIAQGFPQLFLLTHPVSADKIPHGEVRDWRNIPGSGRFPQLQNGIILSP